MRTSTPAHAALNELRRLIAGQTCWATADWALTLHMLEHLAPEFFAGEHLADELGLAVEALANVPSHFPSSLDEHEAMARVDAVYLPAIRGVGTRPLDLPSLRAWIDSNATTAPLQAWFMTELARDLGLELLPLWARPHPFKDSAPLAHLYMLTHEVMRATAFFSRTAEVPQVDELAAALPALTSDHEWDLAAEVAFTVHAFGRDTAATVSALSLAQPAPGLTRRELAHQQATKLVALASALTPPGRLARTGGPAL